MDFICLTAGVNPYPCLYRNFSAYSLSVTSMAASPHNNNNNKKSKNNSNNKPSRPRRTIPKNLRAPRRSKLPPDFGTNQFLKHPKSKTKEESEDSESEDNEEEEEPHSIAWESEELEAITSLFQGRIPQKPGKLSRERSLPLPLPHKLRPLGLPSPKKRRPKIEPFSAKTPAAMVGLAREIKALAAEQDVSFVLEKWTPFLRKGSLSMTVRELGHMGLPERALQTFLWAQGKPSLSPDDRTLSSTVEILARHRSIKAPSSLETVSKGVIESLVKGFVKGGSLRPAWEILSMARRANRTLDPSAYVKLVSELSKIPDKDTLVLTLLDELGERQDLSLSHQDCTALMTACARVGRFESAESLYEWFVRSGREPSVVMYTVLVHGRLTDGRLKEAMEAVWEMEGSDCLLDLPAYRVMIRLFVTVKDIPRASRYFSKLKESGFSPTYDVYRDMISLYLASRRIAKCREICREAEMAGFRVDQDIMPHLSDLAK